MGVKDCRFLREKREGGIVSKVFGNSDYVGVLQELKKNWRSEEERGQCEVAEEGEDRLEVIFTLWIFLGIWRWILRSRKIYA